MSLEKPTDDGVAVTLFPVDYETVEMVTDQGEEVLQQDFSEAQLFMHSIQELERARGEQLKSKRRKTAASSSTLVKPSDENAVTVKEENGAPEAQDVDMEADDNSVGIETEGSGGNQAGDATAKSSEGGDEHDDHEEVIDPRIHYRPMVAELQASIIELNQLINTIELIRQRQFLEDMHCRRENTMETKEDLEYLVESKTQQLKESSRILLAGLSRTEKGLVCIKSPEDYLLRTIQVKLRHNPSGAEGSFTLPAPKVNTMSKAAMDRLENNPVDVKILDERNVSVLKAVQFSVFCEELFYTVMQEALWTVGQWNDSALSAKKPALKKNSKQDDGGVPGPVNISVVDVLDDEVKLRLRDQYDLTIKLLDASTKPQKL
ncbi:hypothetical protein ATCC90586_010187 [Pythium insidiosum]|nr:hypothetical protein ATCC90586_010187 [Pythium insidiosum]